ncbi:MAG: hypothetical protein WBP29_11145 [Candidatus Zixiibacteriota bacterium]
MKTEKEQASIEKYGAPRCIRYMVSSTLEFLEVLHTVNAIIGTLPDRREVESIQRAATFSIIPLPHSESKFIACLNLPVDLLGASSVRRPLLLDFSEYDEPNAKAPIVHKAGMLTITYCVKSLFEVNYAIHHFEANVAHLIPQSQWLRVRRSMGVTVSTHENAALPVQLTVSVEATPALPITSSIR